MNFKEYLRLKWKKFFRSPNLEKNAAFKVFAFIGYFMMAAQILLLSWSAYYIVDQYTQERDLFLAFNRYIYIYLVVALSLLLMLNSFKPAEIKPFMLLPVSKRKIIRFHLYEQFLSPVLWILVAGIMVAAGNFYYHGYPAKGLLLWSTAMIATLFIFNLLSWLNERSAWINFLLSVAIIGSVATIRVAPQWFAPLTDIYAGIYQGNLWLWTAVMLALAAVWTLIVRYMQRHFYLDGKLRRKKTEKIRDWKLPFTERFGMTGAFIQNDIRMIFRNTRTKMIIQSSLFYLLFAAFVYYAPIYRDNDFLYLLVAFTVTAIFLINFGSYVPAWDSEYFKLLMSQSIRYRDYLEAKWWLMFLSVWILLLLALPLAFFGTDIYKIIVAFAFFNAGINTYFVLLTGLLNTRPIKLNEKVQAFSGGQGFNGKLMLMSILRMFLPFIYYYFLRLFFDLDTTLWIVAVTGLAGLLLKNKILDYLARLYNRRKYLMIEKFSKMDET